MNKLKSSGASSGSHTSDPAETTTAENFAASLNNDLNTAQALATVWEQKNNLAKYDEVLGLRLTEKTTVKIPNEVQTLLDQRQTARDNKDFAKSDELRDEIAKHGFEVKDTSDGQEVNQI